MITVYSADATDFSGNGLGALLPESCLVSETLNGEYELTLIHPIDEGGKFRRLAEGNILRAPVPAGKTPRLETGGMAAAATEIWKVATRRSKLYLRSKPTTSSKALGLYRKGTEVTLVEKTSGEWYEVIVPDGKRGYMYASYLDYVRTETTGQAAEKAVVEARRLRDQPFRIYKIVPTLENITVYARHIFYDLMDNMVSEYKPGDNATGAQAFAGLAGATLSEHEFTFYSDVDAKAEDVEIIDKNPAEAILDSEGLIEAYGGELARDWWDVYLAKRVGEETGIQIREGKNLLGISYSIDTTNVATRIIPKGEDADGKPLYLPEKFVENTAEGRAEYHNVKWAVLEVKDAKEKTKGDDKRTKEECYALMREAAEKAFSEGCDLPDVTLKVDFIDCAETEEYSQYKPLQGIHMGDTARVFAKRVGVEVAMRMTQYTYNCLTRQYVSMTLGTVDATIEGNMINPRSIGSGTIKGNMLKLGAVGSGQIADGAVNSLKIALAAIGYAHIKAATIGQLSADAVNAVKATIHELVAGSITTDQLYADLAKIAVAEITTANIDKANINWATITTLTAQMAQIAEAEIKSAKIDWAQIENAQIDAAQIKNLEAEVAKIAEAEIGRAKIDWARIVNVSIGTADIESAAITSAKIALGAITRALIENGAIGAAQIADGSITEAKIVSLNADVIKTGTLSVERLLIKGADGLFRAINATDKGITSTQLDSAAYQNAISGTVLVARSVTADRIAAKSITANEILGGTITAAEIDVSNLFAAAATINALDNYILRTSTIEAIEGALDVWADDKINLRVGGIAIGGRNLLREPYSKRYEFPTAATGDYAPITIYSELEAGAQYTFSAGLIERLAGTATEATAALYRFNDGANNAAVLDRAHFATGTADRQHFTFTVPDDGYEYRLLIYNGKMGECTGKRVAWNEIKLEKGNKATDWTPAPEDVDEKIDQAKAELTIEMGKIEQRVQNTEGDVGTLKTTATSIEGRVKNAEGDITTLKTTAKGLEAKIEDEAAQLQIQIDATAEGVEILAGQTVGSTQLLRETQLLTLGEDSADADGWRPSNGNISVSAGGDGFNRATISASGLTTAAWSGIQSPLVQLPYGWNGREITLSAWVYSSDWTAMEAYGNNAPCYMTFNLSDGTTTRGFYKSFAMVASGGTGWGPQIKANGNIASKVWRRVWLTIALSGVNFASEGDSYTFGNCTHLWVTFGVNMNGELRVKGPKLEFGNVATDWSSHPEELNAGSTMRINKDGIYMQGPEIEMQSADGDDYVRLTAGGVEASSLTAPDVAPRYSGKAIINIKPAATENEIATGNYFRSLVDACEALSRKWLDKNVSISLAAGMVDYGEAVLQGVYGHGSIRITGNGTNHAKLKGRVRVEYVGVPVEITYLDIDVPTGADVAKGAAVYACGGTQVDVRYCEINGQGVSGSNTVGVFAENSAKIRARNCELYNLQRPIYASTLGMIFGQANKGNSTVCVNGGMMMLEGTQPCASTTWTATKYLAGQVFVQNVTVDQGDYPSAVPSQPTTATYTLTHSDSYAGSWTRHSDNDIRQGYLKNARIIGCMWFGGVTALSGKTVLNATLSMYMHKKTGRGVAVSVQLVGVKATYGQSGAPTIVKSYGTIASAVSPGETAAITLPTAAVADLAAGTITALALYSNDTGLYEDRNYSKNYARFAGESTGDTYGKPVLTVRYQ